MKGKADKEMKRSCHKQEDVLEKVSGVFAAQGRGERGKSLQEEEVICVLKCAAIPVREG